MQLDCAEGLDKDERNRSSCGCPGTPEVDGPAGHPGAHRGAGASAAGRSPGSPRGSLGEEEDPLVQPRNGVPYPSGASGKTARPRCSRAGRGVEVLRP